MGFKKGESGNKNAQFKPGQSGNPKGRPKQLPEITKMIADVLGDTNNQGITVAQGILVKWAAMALKGDIRAGEALMERGYGKVKQTLGFDDSSKIKVVIKKKK